VRVAGLGPGEEFAQRMLAKYGWQEGQGQERQAFYSAGMYLNAYYTYLQAVERVSRVLASL